MRLSKYQCPFGPNFVLGLSPAAWFRADTGVTVTGQGASTWADQSGNGRDLLQSTDASRPPYLSYTGTKYLYLPGVASNYASTPDSAAADVTGDIDIQVRLSMVDWTPAADSTIVAKWQAAGQFSYLFRVAASGFLRLLVTNDGTSTVGFDVTSSAANTFTDGGDGWIRVTRASASGDVTFYTGGTGSTPTWVQLGTVKSTTAATIKSGTSVVELGSNTGGTLSLAACNIYRASIYSTIGGTTPVVDFNPNLDASDGSTSFASSATGETWTVNKGSSGLIAYLVGKPWLMGDGSADILATSGFTLNQPLTRYIVGRSLTWTLNDYIADGNAKDSAAFIQSATTPRFKISAGSAIGENAGLALNTTGVMCGVINGASSLTQVNLGTPVTGDAGAANAGGLTLFGSGTVATGFWNGMVAEDITFPTAHDATQRARIIQYLAGRHGIAL